MKKNIIISVFMDGELSLRGSDLPKASQGAHSIAELETEIEFPRLIFKTQSSGLCWQAQGHKMNSDH